MLNPLYRVLSALGIFKVRMLCAFISSALGFSVYGADNSNSQVELNSYLAAEYMLAGDKIKSANLYASIEPKVFLGRARSHFRSGDFPRTIANLDIYLSFGNNDTIALLLRGQAKKLTEPPDIEGACIDFLVVSSHGFDVSAISGIETFCELQPGWGK